MPACIVIADPVNGAATKDKDKDKAADADATVDKAAAPKGPLSLSVPEDSLGLPVLTLKRKRITLPDVQGEANDEDKGEGEGEGEDKGEGEGEGERKGEGEGEAKTETEVQKIMKKYHARIDEIHHGEKAKAREAEVASLRDYYSGVSCYSL